MARRPGNSVDAGFWLLAAVAAAPLLALVAVGAVRFGAVGVDFALDVLVFRIGRFLAVAGVAAAALAVVMALRGRLGWITAVVCGVIACMTLAAFLIQQPGLTTPGATDVSTSPADPPAFSQVTRSARRGAVVADTVSACEGLTTVPRQVEVEQAQAALKAAGFRVVSAAHFRADGERESFWFQLGHDASIRIRPGATDVRVAARSARPQGDTACRLASRIMDGLTP